MMEIPNRKLLRRSQRDSSRQDVTKVSTNVFVSIVILLSFSESG